MAQNQIAVASGIAANYAELSRLHEKRQLAMQSSAIRKNGRTISQTSCKWPGKLYYARAADAARAVTESDLLAIDEHIALQRNRIAALMGQGDQTVAWPLSLRNSSWTNPSACPAIFRPIYWADDRTLLPHV